MERPGHVAAGRLPARRIAAAWLQIGCLGFGGPPAHLTLLRERVVQREGWVDDETFEAVVGVTALLPGPASTQAAVLLAWMVGGVRGALAGAAGFILPGLIAVVALASVVLAASPTSLVSALAAGAGAAVPAVALAAGVMLVAPSRRRAAAGWPRRRWDLYVAAGALATILAGPLVVLCLLACGAAELLARRGAAPRPPGRADARAGGTPGSGRGGGGALRELASAALVPLAAAALVPSTALALAWMGVKLGALSYGGGFVIVPMMQADAVDVHGWLSEGQFLSAVAIGQVVPGPVVNTGTAIGWAVAGLPGALIVATAIFGPTIVLALLAGRSLQRLRADARAAAFLAGAAPAAIGAILGSSVPLALGLQEPWQLAVLVAATAALLGRRTPVPLVLLAAALLGTLAWQLGAPIPS